MEERFQVEKQRGSLGLWLEVGVPLCKLPWGGKFGGGREGDAAWPQVRTLSDPSDKGELLLAMQKAALSFTQKCSVSLFRLLISVRNLCALLGGKERVGIALRFARNRVEKEGEKVKPSKKYARTQAHTQNKGVNEVRGVVGSRRCQNRAENGETALKIAKPL